jgi:menaquinone-dependent protoporphyrinogen IX oxidase
VEANQQALSQRPVAYFLTALELTRTVETRLGDVPIYRDPALGKAPKNPDKLSRKEKFTTVAAYLGPTLEKAPSVKPISAGFFAGALDYGKLNIFQKLFVKIVIRAEAGDFRNWEVIREWATSLRPALWGE